MGTKLTRWHKAGRFVTGIVVLCFFLPFFGVSCNGLDVVTVSGADMVGGCKPGGLASESGGDMSGGDGGLKIEKVDFEPLAAVALGCALIGFGLAWVRSRGALIGALVVSLAGLGALAGLYVRVGGKMNDAVELQKETRSKGELSRDMHIEAGARMGFYLAGLGLLAVAGLTIMAITDKNGGVPRATAAPYPPPGAPPGPPGGYPPPPG
jgi:hypothetical protein